MFSAVYRFVAMRLWISIAAGIPLGATVIHHFRSLPWFEYVINSYPEFKYSIDTGVSVVDQPVSLVANVFGHAMNNTLGYNLSWILLGIFGVVLSMMAVEGSRQNASRLLACFPLWGLACNFMGMAVQPLFWLPVFYASFDKVASNNVEAHFIRNARSNAILVVMVAVYVIPTAFMLLATEPESSMQRIIIVVWQFLPLLMGPLLSMATSSLKCLDEPEDLRMNEIAREKIRVADSRNAVERLYMILGIFNTLIYYGIYIRLKMDNMLSWETFVDLTTLYSGKLTALSMEQMGQIITNHAFFIEIIIAYITCLFWALLESGMKGAFIMLIASIIIGPGAGICLYAVYREGHIQDIEKVVKKNE